MAQDWTETPHLLVTVLYCSHWHIFQHLEEEVGLQIWLEAGLLVEMVLVVV